MLFSILAIAIIPSSAFAVTDQTISSGDWSDNTIWSLGRSPITNDTVIISPTHTVTYSTVSTLDIPLVQVNGTLNFNPSVNTEMDVGMLLIYGQVNIGTETQPIDPSVKAIVKLTNYTGYIYTHNHSTPGLAPAIHTHGGHLDIHGAKVTPTWSLLSVNASAGTSILSLNDSPIGWNVGDSIVIAGTGLIGQLPSCALVTLNTACNDPSTFTSESNTISSISGNVITLATPLKYDHIVKGAEQTGVGLLSRNVIITSKHPEVLQGNVHIANSPKSIATGKISYAEFDHLGRHTTGIYPLHFHQLGDGTNDYAIGNSIHDSQNVMLRVHDTNNLLVRGNVLYNGIGNGLATESGNEINNVIDQNMVVFTKPGGGGINCCDTTDQNQGDGIWINNAKNTITNNYVSNSYGWAYHPIATKTSSVNPILKFDNNMAQGTGFGGIEVNNIIAPTESVLNKFTSNNPRITNISIVQKSQHITFTNFLAHRDDFKLRYNNFLNNNDIEWYTSPLDVKFINGTADFVQFGYQGVGPLLLKNVQFKQFSRATESPAEGIIVIDPVPQGATLGFSNQKDFTNSTTQSETYLMNYYGQGQHVKLIPPNSIPADNLVYTQNSPASNAYLSMPMQQALFNDSTLVALKLPIRVDIGRVPILSNPDPTVYNPHDYFEANGTRWQLNNIYVQAPKGYEQLPRLGTGNFNNGMPSPQWVTGNLIQSYMQSTNDLFFNADLPNGNYKVSMGFEETQTKDRWMYITANGAIKVGSFDLIKAAKGTYKPYWKTFPVSVTNGHLVLDVKGSQPILNAIKIVAN